MEKQPYSYGMKLAGFILHLFFTVVLTISVFLLAAMIGKSIFRITDVGTEQFLESGYYTKCIEQKCNDLSDYMKLLIKGDDRTQEESKRYLRYTNEFNEDETNFCYWYRVGENWYTNQPDTEDGTKFDTEAVLMEAKTMGNYIIYDLMDKEFGTNIRGMADYFFGGYGNQMNWPSENMTLIIGIDTDLSAKDDLQDASIEYARLHPWIKVCIFCGLISLIGWIITLVYMTLAAGRREGEEIHLNAIDRIKTEILAAGFIFIISELAVFVTKISSDDWAVYGIAVASGTVSLLIDALFLLFYLSMVRRMKAEVLWETSLACWLGKGIHKVFSERKTTTRILILFLIHMIVCFVLAVWAFYYGSIPGLVLLLLFSGYECYLFLRKGVEQQRIIEGIERIKKGYLSEKIETEDLHGDEKLMAESVNNIGEGLLHAVDDSTKNERMKADLITNVSHDIKTPLTSIINYVNLIKMEKIENERVQGYVKILDEKSQRLKQLTEDLVEASKISSGNVKLDMQTIDLVELVYQTSGEFNEKFEQKELTIVTKMPKTEVYIRADGRQLYRVIENLYNNVAKYALEKTRVYVDIFYQENKVVFSIKNVSERSLARENSNAGDLTERFIRGDSSRTTEGSGLGLSIAKNLTVLMGGTFDIKVDGDLFKATIIFPPYMDGAAGNPEEIQDTEYITEKTESEGESGHDKSSDF